MDFQSAMETFAEAWVAANSKGGPLSDLSVQNQALALTRNCKSPPTIGNLTACQSRCDSREHLDINMHTPAPSVSVTSHVDTDPMVSPPSVKDGHEKSLSGKSLPVHCIVETICSLEESRYTGHWQQRSAVETDSFVIIPINTPFQELVQAALQRLGYPSDSIYAAKGSLVMKNWKQLAFSQISDDPAITVGEILGELTTVVTLKIQMYRARRNALIDIKDKLLKLLLLQSQGRLVASGCPLDELFLSHICRMDGLPLNSQQIPEPSEDCRRKFDHWWASQLNTQNLHPTIYNMANKSLECSTSSLNTLQEQIHPAMQTVQHQYPTQKTRMRTSFDPELELPKLQHWFNDNQHPSRQQIQQYVKELNNLESRRGRKPLDVNNVVYWFKNARAAQKRAEVRNLSPNICHLAANGYNSSSHSPPNDSGLMLSNDKYGHLKRPTTGNYERNSHHISNLISENMSMADSDLENDDVGDEQQRTDEEAQLRSPSVPLSLTTNRKRDQLSISPPMIPVSTRQCIKEPKIEPKIEPIEESVDLHPNNMKMKNPLILTNKKDNNTQKNFEDESMNSTLHLEETLRQHRLCSPQSDQENSQLMMHASSVAESENLDRLTAGFPLVPNSMFSHSIMYMSHFIPGLSHPHNNISTNPAGVASGTSGLSISALAAEERRKRNRTFIDPVTEVPRLEHWFTLNTHPSHSLILKYTDELNCMTYRQKFPRLEPKNVQFWFKNRRAKCKRLKMSLFDNQGHPEQYLPDRE